MEYCKGKIFKFSLLLAVLPRNLLDPPSDLQTYLVIEDLWSWQKKNRIFRGWGNDKSIKEIPYLQTFIQTDIFTNGQTKLQSIFRLKRLWMYIYQNCVHRSWFPKFPNINLSEPINQLWTRTKLYSHKIVPLYRKKNVYNFNMDKAIEDILKT